MNLREVEPREVPDLWPLIRDRVASCCERSGGKYEPVDVLLNFFSGRMELWLVLGESGHRESPASALEIKAVVITEVVAYPRAKVCKLLACTGEGAARWAHLVERIEDWARRRGCTVMEPICRPGWERYLKSKGYRKTHVVLEKNL